MAGVSNTVEAADTPRDELPILLLRFFQRKSFLCSNNVLAHRFTRFFRVALADRAIDSAMEIEGFVEIVGALDRLAATLVKDR